MARANCFEGGSDETNVSTGNSGGASGNAFNDVGRGTGATVVYDTAQSALGSFSCRTSTGGTSATAYVAYTLASVTTDYSRAYLRLTGLPSASAQPVMRYMSGANQSFRVNIKSGGAIEVRDAGNNVVGTTTATVSTSAWFRIEIRTVQSTTVGVVELRYYASQHSTSPTETLNLTGLTLTANATEIRFGVGAGLSNAVSVWFDNVATEGSTWFGPALISGTAAPAFTAEATAAGARLATGTAVSAFSFDTTTAGTVTVQGAAAPALTFGTAAAGQRTVLGTAAPAATFTAAASGLHTVYGAASLPGQFSAIAEGVGTSAGMGVAEATFTAGATASGLRTTFGSAASGFTFAATAAGIRNTSGSATAGGTFTATTAGLHTVLAAVATSASFTAAAAGTRAVHGTAATTVTFAATGTGTSAALRPGVLVASNPSAALAAATSRPALAASGSRPALTATTSP